MKKNLIVLRPFGIVLGISALIIFSSLGLAGFSSYFYKNEAKTNFHKDDYLRVVVSPKGKKDWQYCLPITHKK